MSCSSHLDPVPSSTRSSLRKAWDRTHPVVSVSCISTSSIFTFNGVYHLPSATHHSVITACKLCFMSGFKCDHVLVLSLSGPARRKDAIIGLLL